MKLLRLCKIEVYRFFHSLEIIKYFVIIPIVLVMMCYMNIFSVRNDISIAAIWGSMSQIYLYILISLIILISIYVGREYRYKTVNYEVIREFGICRIAMSKTFTCGILVPCVYTICLLTYLFFMTDNFTPELIWRMILMCVVHTHICALTVLYVMLCKNGVLGGVVAFARLFIWEIIVQLILTDSKSKIAKLILQFQMFQQWNDIISIESPLRSGYILVILISTIVEYGILLFLLRLFKKNNDFL